MVEGIDKETDYTGSGQAVVFDLNLKAVTCSDLPGSPGCALLPVSRVVCVKQCTVSKHYTGFISLLCCVRMLENSVTKVLEAYIAGIICQFSDSHYIIYTVCVFTHTHIYTHTLLYFYW